LDSTLSMLPAALRHIFGLLRCPVLSRSNHASSWRYDHRSPYLDSWSVLLGDWSGAAGGGASERSAGVHHGNRLFLRDAVFSSGESAGIWSLTDRGRLHRRGTRPVAAEELGPDGNGCTGKHLAAVWSDRVDT